MSKRFLFNILICLIVPMIAQSATIERYCFVSQFGTLYDVRGGRLGKKAYLVQTGSNVLCPVLAGLATFARLDDGYLMTSVIIGDPAGACRSYQITLLFDENLLTGTGTYDFFPRDNSEGGITLTQTTCPPSISRLVPTTDKK